MLGLPPDDLVGRDFTSLVHPDDIPSVLDARSKLDASPTGHVANDVRLRHRDGTWRVVHGVGTNLLDDPAVGAVVGNYRDVTAERVLEEQVRRTQQWEAIGLLAGGIAHDFNNLLCIIMSAASTAQTSAAQGTREAAALADIHEAAARAAELTRKLLTLGRSHPLAMEHLDASLLVSDFVALIKRSLGEDLEIAVTCEGPLPVWVDRLQMEQVLLNVCTNARQATEGRGRVRIEGRCISDSAAGERFVEIAISDDGPGMEDATRRRVFDPFFTTKRGGSGLGLTVSYGIVQRHGGSMRIESQPGHGTVVRVRLPAREGPAKAPAADEAPAAEPTAGLRVLVAEDEPSLRRIFSRVLRGAGYDVIEAEDGELAVAKFAAEPDGIGLVVLDVRLPGLSGPAAYRQMVRRRPDLPVLFVTGHAPDSIAIPRGAALLMKPFTAEGLRRAIEGVTRKALMRSKS